jgi:hypothetical protein
MNIELLKALAEMAGGDEKVTVTVAELQAEAKKFDARAFKPGDIVQRRTDLDIPYKFPAPGVPALVVADVKPSNNAERSPYTQDSLLIITKSSSGKLHRFTVDPVYFETYTGE